MKTEILEQKKNVLMNREEIKMLVFDEKTPSFSEAEEIISKEFNKSRENIDVQRIKGKFGRKSFLISAFVYDSAELKMRLAKKTKKENKLEEKPEEKTEKKEAKEQAKPEERGGKETKTEGKTEKPEQK